LSILFSGDISLSNEESGTHLNFKNQKVEVMSLFYGFSELNIVSLFNHKFQTLNFKLYLTLEKKQKIIIIISEVEYEAKKKNYGTVTKKQSY
jgi:hypothetical protein